MITGTSLPLLSSWQTVTPSTPGSIMSSSTMSGEGPAEDIRASAVSPSPTASTVIPSRSSAIVRISLTAASSSTIMTLGTSGLRQLDLDGRADPLAEAVGDVRQVGRADPDPLVLDDDGAAPGAQPHLPATAGVFDGVAQQDQQNLLHPLGVGEHAAGLVRLDVEPEPGALHERLHEPGRPPALCLEVQGYQVRVPWHPPDPRPAQEGGRQLLHPASLGEDVVQETPPDGRVRVFPRGEQLGCSYDGHGGRLELVGGVGQETLLAGF